MINKFSENINTICYSCFRKICLYNCTWSPFVYEYIITCIHKCIKNTIKRGKKKCLSVINTYIQCASLKKTNFLCSAIKHITFSDRSIILYPANKSALFAIFRLKNICSNWLETNNQKITESSEIILALSSTMTFVVVNNILGH